MLNNECEQMASRKREIGFGLVVGLLDLGWDQFGFGLSKE